MSSDYQRWKCNKCGHVVEVLYGHGKPDKCPVCQHTVLLAQGVVKK